jgi:3-isopropylmalate/(R)-2-methylmalate dehydratase small subunit
MQAIRKIVSRTVVLDIDDVDTDQIIPARFLTTTTREGLGKNLFHDWRYRDDGSPDNNFILNSSAVKGCEVLVAGRNFGCGSSREHAPWALLDFGIRAVISTEFADIFRSNSLKNGLLPIVVPEEIHARLLHHAGEVISIDVTNSSVTLPDQSTYTYPIDTFARYCIVEGIDQLGYLQKHAADIQRFEETRSWTP